MSIVGSWMTLFVVSLVFQSAFSQAAFSYTPTLSRQSPFHATFSRCNPSSSQIDFLQRASLVSLASSSESGNENDGKFGFGQRIESLKCLVIGALSGSIAVAPICALDNLWLRLWIDADMLSATNNGLAQWEFDNDAASLEAGLFAIVYRYCIRQDNNPQLGQGVVGAFAITRTCARILVPSYCSTIPLDCGSPLGYLDWSMISQLAMNGAESMVLFGATAAAMDYVMARGFVSRFPG